MEEKAKLSEYLLSPFVDDEETIKIKEFAEKIKQLDDFKDLNLNFVKCCDTPTLGKKLKLIKTPKKFFLKAVSFMKGVKSSIGGTVGIYSPVSKKILIFVDTIIRDNKFDIKVDLSQKRLEVKKDLDYSKFVYPMILKVMYHEKRHYLQEKIEDNSFLSMVYQIENILKLTPFGILKYKNNHDGWYMEIDANDYGVNKANEYFLNNPQAPDYDRDYIDYYIRLCKIQKSCYDFDSFFTAYNVYREKIPFYNLISNKVNSFFEKSKGRTWHNVLYGDRKRLRSVEQILSDPQIDELDPLFVNYVLTSRYLNDHTDYTKLNIDIVKRIYSEFMIRYRRIINDVILNDDAELLDVCDLMRIRKELLYCYRKMDYLQRKVLHSEEHLEKFNIDYLDFIIDSKKKR